MTLELAQKPYSVQHFLALDLPDDDEEDYELIEGEVVRQGATSGKHADIVTRVSTALDVFGGVAAGENRKGKVFSAGSTNLGQPQGRHVPKPDVCFVLSGNGPAEFDGPIPVAPHLVVEVNSPSDTDERRFDKLQAYHQAGVTLIWSIHVLEKFVVVYQHDQTYPRFLTTQDTLDAGPVLPGFQLPVAALFE